MTKKTVLLIEAIDDLLPQTQCGLCGYGGCRPYAEAISLHNEEINRCPPGGTKTLLALATLMNQDATPYLEDMGKKMKAPSRAVIREDECIGCTKCIQACPVDAILGSAKKMHTVIADECTGCELCIEPCPVDCIDIMTIELSEELQRTKPAQFRKRFHARQQRLTLKDKEEIAQIKKFSKEDSIESRKKAIQEAIVRVRAKKEQAHEC